MKYLIGIFLSVFLLLFAYSSTAQAGSWRPSFDHGTSFYKKGACQKKTGQACFNFKNCPEAYCEAKDLQVDDHSKPLYGPKLNVSGGFTDLTICMSGIAGYCNDLEPDPGYDVRTVCAPEGGGTFEIYCIASIPQSYEQKTVRRLVEDATKKSTYDAAQAVTASDQSSRSAKRIARRTALKACIAVLRSESPGIAAIKNCVRRLVREVMEKELSTNEL